MAEKLSLEEKKLRKELSEQLGVEFLSEDEVDDEVESAVADEPPSPTPSPAMVQERPVQVSEIIRRCNEAGSKMSVRNPNRFLMYMCGTALRQLVQLLDARDREIVELRKKYEQP